MICGIVENQVPECGATGAVCQNSRNKRVLDATAWLLRRFLRDNSLGHPGNCRNLNEILTLWGSKGAGVF